MKTNAIYQLKHTFKTFLATHSAVIDRYQCIVMYGIIAMILLWAIHLLDRPVAIQQRQEVVQYTAQYLYPHTQGLATDLLQQKEPINQYKYFKFLRILHFERNRIHFQKNED
ncbi:hypothetical protein GCM10023206_10470 [Acinetobacter puyangensis]|uniref:Uncharacterized protein n=1 Tax=Acinetobacter puyangensis TaxID=1096779 RepID=A0A240EBK1_9GAMM|nr:hypothetical protein [Acinetobacter puyangensis]SNX45643.1 hypothetical protein SAMN05421731_105197 [Acinetobacter puyangensis]